MECLIFSDFVNTFTVPNDIVSSTFIQGFSFQREHGEEKFGKLFRPRSF